MMVGHTHTRAHTHTYNCTHTLQLIGATLQDCVSNDGSAWVVYQALDSIYDIFGDDSCLPSLCVSLSLLPALRQLASVIKEKVNGKAPLLKIQYYPSMNYISAVHLYTISLVKIQHNVPAICMCAL